MATWYASTAVPYGTNNAGTSSGTETNLVHALSLAGAGDTVLFRDAGMEWQADLNTTNGIACTTAGVALIGYQTTPGDAGMPVVRNTNATTTACVLQFTGAYQILRQIKFYDCKRLDLSTTGQSTRIERLWIENFSDHGISCSLTNAPPQILNTTIKAGTATSGSACGINTTGRHLRIEGCTILGAFLKGMNLVTGTYGSTVVRNVISGAGIGIYNQGASLIAHNTIYNATTGAAIFLTGANGPVEILGNAISGWATYAIDSDTSGYTAEASLVDNLLYGTGSGYYGANLTCRVERGTLHADPLFTNAAGNDFTPQSSSPLIRAGYGNRTIGAVEGAGGGTLKYATAG